MTSLAQVFAYADHRIRMVMIDSLPWFVALDVLRVLSIGNVTDAMRALDDDEFDSTEVVDAAGRRQPGTYIVNEPGLYSLILRSRKPEARPFKRWVTHDVLPEIRRTGAYGYATTLLPPEQPGTYTLEDSVSLLRQYFMVPVRSVYDLTALLRDAGLFRQRPAPRTAYEHLFWNTGSSWTVRRTGLAEVAYRLNTTYRAINGPDAPAATPAGRQLTFEFDHRPRAVTDEPTGDAQ